MSENRELSFPSTRTPSSARSVNVIALRGAIVLGCAGVLLLLAARGDLLPGRVQSFLQANAAAWTLFSAALFCGGIAGLWGQVHRRAGWEPTLPGRRFHSVVLYTRGQCPLCEEAGELLAEYRRWLPAAVEVDVDETPELRERFDTCVPVVEFDGRIRFRGRVSEVLLERLIEGTPPLPRARHR